MPSKRATEAFNEIVAHGYLEDRQEYTKEDLQCAYPNLTPDEVQELYTMVQNPTRANITAGMHDLVAHFQSGNAYHDFEGMANPRPVLNLCKNPTTQRYIWDTNSTIDRVLARSLLLAYLYERADTYGIDDFSHSNVIDLWEAIETILSCRWFSKVTDEMIQELENEPDED